MSLAEHRQTLLVFALLVGGMLWLFALDVRAPYGVIESFGYPVLLTLCLWLPYRSLLIVCAVVFTALTFFAGLVPHKESAFFDGPLFNRMLVVASIWSISLLLWHRISLEAELRMRRDEAIAVSRAKSNFLARMSHELRTPLNAIIGFSDILMHDAVGRVGNPKYPEYARHINESGYHLLSLINDVLDLAKIEAGKYQLQEELVVLQPLVTGAIRMLGPGLQRAKLEIRAEVPEGLPRIRADRRALKQILLNLLANAVKFTPEGGRVTVSAELRGDGLCIAVADTGVGIPEADLARLGRPFEQVNDQFARSKNGVGLGLALCRDLAELHGGRLAISSGGSKGTTVSLLLPRERVIMDREAA